MDLQTDLSITVATAGIYGVIYIALTRVGPFHARDEKTKIVTSTAFISMINAALVMPCAFKLLWDVQGTDLWSNPAMATLHSNAMQDFCLSMLCAYVLFDGCTMLQNYELVGDRLLLLHHCVIALSVTWAQALHVGTFYLCVLCVNEMSTIPLNLRYMMLYSDMHDTIWYTVNGAVFLITFFVFRVLAIGLILWHVIQGWSSHAFDAVFTLKPGAYQLVLALTVLLSVHYVVNLFWFLQVAKHAKRGIMRLIGSQEVSDTDQADSYGACEDAYDSRAEKKCDIKQVV